MPTPTKGPRLGGGPAHERLILANLATSLFQYGRITTTETKAKRLRPLAERLITFAKRGDLAARRRVLTVVRDKSVVHVLFTEIAPTMAERQGGYTRITKVGNRKGDNAPMAVIELVTEPVSAKQAVVREAEGATKRSVRSASKPAKAKKSTEAAEPTADATEATATDAPVAEETVVEETAGTTAPAATERVRGDRDAKNPYGEGSVWAEEGVTDAPEGFAVKGNEDSGKYHVPGSRWYDQTVAEVWFADAAAAEAAGFTPAGGAAAQKTED